MEEAVLFSAMLPVYVDKEEKHYFMRCYQKCVELYYVRIWVVLPEYKLKNADKRIFFHVAKIFIAFDLAEYIRLGLHPGHTFPWSSFRWSFPDEFISSVIVPFPTLLTQYT
jgi:hypothetical protein